MAARYLLDTNICIYIVRHKPAEVRRRFERLKAGEAAISAVTFGELHYGAVRSQHPREAQVTLQELTSFLPVLPLPADAGLEYGRIRASLEKSGKPIGGNDLWIAAHATSAGLILVTNNEREFKRVASLTVENWVDRSQQ